MIVFENIYWRAFVKAKTEDKAEKVIKNMEISLGFDISTDKFERYWKDQTLYEITFTSPLAIERVEEAVLKTLVIANKVSKESCVIGPNCHENEHWEFEGFIKKQIYWV